MKYFIHALSAILIVLCLSAGVFAATFVVNTATDTDDVAAGDGTCADGISNCSLRAAISEANALAGPDTITLGAFTYTQTLGPRDESMNAGGDWDIKSDITINGVDQATTILAGTGCTGIRDRVLDVGGGITVTLNNLTVRSGCQSNVAPFPGGGISNSGSLTLNNVTVRDNFARNFEGGASGGGIFNTGSLTLNDSTITNNIVNNGMFGGSAGGGIASFTTSPVVINNSSITGNRAESSNGQGLGGGMYAGQIKNLTITNSHFDGNFVGGTANSGGGGLYILADVDPAVDPVVNIAKSTFNDNTATGTNASGAGIYVLDSSSFNTSVFVDQTTIDGNNATGDGAGLQAFSTRGHLFLYVQNSTISNNISAANGGAVGMGNGTAFASTLNPLFTNTTISGNSATEGGAIFGSAGFGFINTRFDYCTLTNNTASVRGGGIAEGPNSFTLYLGRTVVAGNTAPSGNDISFTHQTISSFDYNHIGDFTGVIMTGPVANNTTGPAILGTLTDNDGPTLTHMPNAASPLVDAIPIGQYTCGSEFDSLVYGDQRGFGRPFGSGCDKGAVERGASLAAGPWVLSGVVKTVTGMPIRNAAVTISGGNLAAPKTVFTGNFGTYQFLNLSGNEYTLTVSIKRYHFNDAIVVVQLDQNRADIDFIANAPFGREVLDLGPSPVKGKGLR